MIKGTPSKETVLHILDRLSSDNDFREHFLGDPAGALKGHGIDIDSSRIPPVRRLPSKQEMAKARDQAAAVDNPLEKVGLFFFLLK